MNGSKSEIATILSEIMSYAVEMSPEIQKLLLIKAKRIAKIKQKQNNNNKTFLNKVN